MAQLSPNRRLWQRAFPTPKSCTVVRPVRPFCIERLPLMQRTRSLLSITRPHSASIVSANRLTSVRAYATQRTLVPPFNEETARAKVQAAEDLWNGKDPEKVALAYTEDSQWRNRDRFLRGREAIKAFLREKWAKEHQYRLRKELFCYTNDRIAVSFNYEYHDDNGRWWRAYGLEHWTFDERGLMHTRHASINDVPIEEKDRILK